MESGACLKKSPAVLGCLFMRKSGYCLPHVVIGYALTVLAAPVAWPVLCDPPESGMPQ
jgi:hypothetical protein